MNKIIGGIATLALVLGIVSVVKQDIVVGPQGKQGVQGIKGDKGDRGQQGIQGEKGERGQKGESGAIGMPGKLGAAAGTDHYFTEFFHAGLIDGGGIRATSTVNSAETLLASDFNEEKIIAYTLNVQDATLTLPATSTLTSFIPTAGQTRSIFIRNATTTASMDLTIAAGAGMNFITASSTNVIKGSTSGANSARLDFSRRADRDMDVAISIFLK